MADAVAEEVVEEEVEVEVATDEDAGSLVAVVEPVVVLVDKVVTTEELETAVLVVVGAGVEEEVELLKVEVELTVVDDVVLELVELVVRELVVLVELRVLLVVVEVDALVVVVVRALTCPAFLVKV